MAWGNSIFTVCSETDSIITLDKCISLALLNNHKVKISGEEVKIADSRLKQAKSAFYPSLSFSAKASIMDENLMFIMPGQEYVIDLPHIPGITIDKIKTPPTNAVIMDKANAHTRFSLTLPIYTGGKTQAINMQAENNVDIARNNKVQTDREIIFDIKQYYYSYILAKRMLDLLNETTERLEATLNLTESLYINGSGKVTKLDYTKNKVLVDQVKNLKPEFEKNYIKSREALQFSSGNSLPDNFSVRSYDIPFIPVSTNYDEVLRQVYLNNPDWTKINKAVEILIAKTAEAKSSLFPSVGIFANMDANFNDFNYGLSNDYNKYIWTVGIGIQYDIFSGFRTSAQIEEAESGLSKVKEEKLLLKDALELQIKNIFHDIAAQEKSVISLSESRNNADENCSLTERSFNQNITDTGELIQAQIMASLVQIQYLKALYEYTISCARLELISGIEIHN